MRVAAPQVSLMFLFLQETFFSSLQAEGANAGQLSTSDLNLDVNITAMQKVN